MAGIPRNSPVYPWNLRSLVATCTDLWRGIVASRVEMDPFFEMGFKGHIFRVLSGFDFYGGGLGFL
jgi:hypothetical protein